MLLLSHLIYSPSLHRIQVQVPPFLVLSRPFIHTFIKNVLSSSSLPAIMVEETSTVKERVMTPALWRLWASWEIRYWSRNHTNERQKNSNYGQWRKPVTWGFRGIRSNLHSQKKTSEWWIQEFARWGGEGRALPTDRGRMRSKHLAALESMEYTATDWKALWSVRRNQGLMDPVRLERGRSKSWKEDSLDRDKEQCREDSWHASAVF